MQVKSYKDLQVWVKSMDLVTRCYRATSTFPKHEIYGLRSQLQRAAVSVPANIAEGSGREHIREYLHHLAIANGSLTELETHIQIATRLGYLHDRSGDSLLQHAGEVGKMLSGLRASLRRRTPSS